MIIALTFWAFNETDDSQNINEMRNLVEGVGMMQHTLENFNDDLTMILVENKLRLN